MVINQARSLELENSKFEVRIRLKISGLDEFDDALLDLQNFMDANVLPGLPQEQYDKYIDIQNRLMKIKPAIEEDDD